jgi:hypothetical protein
MGIKILLECDGCGKTEAEKIRTAEEVHFSLYKAPEERGFHTYATSELFKRNRAALLCHECYTEVQRMESETVKRIEKFINYKEE